MVTVRGSKVDREWIVRDSGKGRHNIVQNVFIYGVLFVFILVWIYIFISSLRFHCCFLFFYVFKLLFFRISTYLDCILEDFLACVYYSYDK